MLITQQLKWAWFGKSRCGFDKIPVCKVNLTPLQKILPMHLEERWLIMTLIVMNIKLTCNGCFPHSSNVAHNLTISIHYNVEVQPHLLKG